MFIENKIKVEVCAFSLESCLNAQSAGASRIELCSGLYEGGTTPSIGLISEVKKQIKIELSVMIRPRGGDFLYSPSDLKVMYSDIESAKKAGADGIVIGILMENGMVDLQKTKELVQRASPMKVTFHRAIDVTPNPYEALETIIEAGCIRILTSGQKNKAIDGLKTIGLLVEKAKNRIEIMAGAGLNAENIDYFIQKNVNAVHLTGKSIRQSAMKYRNSEVSMSDFDQIPEFDIIYSDYQKIKDIVDKVNNYKN